VQGNAMLAGMANSARALVVQADADSQLSISMLAMCNDAAAADQFKKAADGIKAMLNLTTTANNPSAAEAARTLNAMQFTVSGSNVGASLKLDAANTLIPAIQALRAHSQGPLARPNHRQPKP
jgi:hypothetical protein